MFDYYKTPSDEIFEDMKDCAIRLWNRFDDTYGYRTEKLEMVNRLDNNQDNIRYIYGMFDMSNKFLLKAMVKPETLALIEKYEEEMDRFLL